MSPLYLHDGKLLVENNAVATSQNCCCDNGSSSSSSSSICDCYQLNYLFTINDCGGSPQNYVGSVRLTSGGIVCYDDNINVVAATKTSLTFGAVCAPSLTIICGDSITTIIISSAGNAVDVIQVPGNVCCGFVVNDTWSFPDHDLGLTLDLNNVGPCDCSGYTNV